MFTARTRRTLIHGGWPDSRRIIAEQVAREQANRPRYLEIPSVQKAGYDLSVVILEVDNFLDFLGIFNVKRAPGTETDARPW